MFDRIEQGFRQDTPSPAGLAGRSRRIPMEQLQAGSGVSGELKNACSHPHGNNSLCKKCFSFYGCTIFSREKVLFQRCLGHAACRRRNAGMRKLPEPALVKRARETLKGRARIKRTMWSRQAQEYEAKINSGDTVAIAEVVRDLYRSESQPEQSCSERQLYEAALDRLSREIAVLQHVTETEAVKEIEGQLAKSPRRGAETEAGADGDLDADADADADGDEAAVAALCRTLDNSKPGPKAGLFAIRIP
jgi:hypothetical protein